MGSRETTTSRIGSDIHCGFRIANSQWLIGFTLIEVVLVAVVLAILLTAAVPRFQQTAERLRVEQAAFEFAQLLRMAHERAVAESRAMVWVWDAAAHRARLEPDEGSDGFGNVQPPAPQPPPRGLAESSVLPAAISVSVSGEGGASGCSCVHFFPEGTSEPATLILSAGERAYTVTVDEATSRVRLSAGRTAR